MTNKQKKLRKVPTWDQWVMRLAIEAASRSKHPETQVGCVMLDPDTKAIVGGPAYNGMVMGLTETWEMWNDPDPLTRTVHAEKNAVAMAAKLRGGLYGATAYVTRMPCWECTILMAQAGIGRIVVLCVAGVPVTAPGHTHEYQRSLALLTEVGIVLEFLEDGNVFEPTCPCWTTGKYVWVEGCEGHPRESIT